MKYFKYRKYFCIRLVTSVIMSNKLPCTSTKPSSEEYNASSSSITATRWYNETPNPTQQGLQNFPPPNLQMERPQTSLESMHGIFTHAGMEKYLIGRANRKNRLLVKLTMSLHPPAFLSAEYIHRITSMYIEMVDIYESRQQLLSEMTRSCITQNMEQAENPRNSLTTIIENIVNVAGLYKILNREPHSHISWFPRVDITLCPPPPVQNTQTPRQENTRPVPFNPLAAMRAAGRRIQQLNQHILAHLSSRRSNDQPPDDVERQSSASQSNVQRHLPTDPILIIESETTPTFSAAMIPEEFRPRESRQIPTSHCRQRKPTGPIIGRYASFS